MAGITPLQKVLMGQGAYRTFQEIDGVKRKGPKGGKAKRKPARNDFERGEWDGKNK